VRKFLSSAALAAFLISTQTAAQARDGGAIAAGIIGGLALGGLAAAAAAQPAYGYPAYGYAPYGYRRVYYAPVERCWRERRRAHDEFGNVYYRRVRICG
jgi:hypothetical protein